MINDGEPGRAPISPKVSNGTVGGVAVLLVTWALTYFIPAWQSAIPGPLQALIPGVLGAGGFYITGYASKHVATTMEIIRAIRKGQVVLSEIENVLHPVIDGGPATMGYSRAVKDQPQA